MMEKIKITDTVKIGSYEEVSGLQLSTLTKKSTDTALLDGLILRGYETKFGKTNENGERYESGCLDNFIESYFVANGLNMVVDVQHRNDIDNLVGRVLLLEVNSVGFYFIVYIPKSIRRYEEIKNLLQEGILQGFSKEGFASEYEFMYKANGEFDYMRIKEMNIMSVSLVSNPANHVTFEKMQEVANSLHYKNTLTDKTDKATIEDDFINELFN